MHFREAYNHAVSDIKWLAGNPDTAEARHDLAALRALIILLEGKLPPEQVDYETDSEGHSSWRCKACSALAIAPLDWRPARCPRCGEEDWDHEAHHTD